ncbi:hypothetical protein [Beijerinckia sp. L45]|uniref:hypothetical protein n=1 Tax=Beijerinckia sp. L45 TaxID=1641855 RepID=UPI001FEE8167|nr:hypothetical protein [Beijerinckia sp. L45]
MSLPTPDPGLVIRYAYLWRHEAQSGRDEGRKDRPCGVIGTNRTTIGQSQTSVLPITHTEPSVADMALEIPAAVGSRLGLDAARSWIVLTEANLFAWPGPDLRFVEGREPRTIAYGFFRHASSRTFEAAFLTTTLGAKFRSWSGRKN